MILSTLKQWWTKNSFIALPEALQKLENETLPTLGPRAYVLSAYYEEEEETIDYEEEEKAIKKDYTFNQLLYFVEKGIIHLYGYYSLSGEKSGDITKIPSRHLPGFEVDEYRWDKDDYKILDPLKIPIYVDIKVRKKDLKKIIKIWNKGDLFY